MFEDGCEELQLSENSSDNSILFINSTFGQAPGISKLYFMCSDESEIFLSICDSTGRWKPDPADIPCNSSIIIPPTIPTTNSTDIDDDAHPGQDVYNMPTMPRDLIPSFSLYVMAGLVLLLFVMTLSIAAIIWQWLKRNKNASITTQQVVEPIYESIMDDDADTQVNASYQVCVRVDLTKNEAYASAGVAAQKNQFETENYKPAITMGTANITFEENSVCMEETIHSTHTCAQTVLAGAGDGT